MQARQVITCGVWKSEARIARVTTASRVGGIRGGGETCTNKKHKTTLVHDGTRFNVSDTP